MKEPTKSIVNGVAKNDANSITSKCSRYWRICFSLFTLSLFLDCNFLSKLVHYLYSFLSYWIQFDMESWILQEIKICYLYMDITFYDNNLIHNFVDDESLSTTDAINLDQSARMLNPHLSLRTWVCFQTKVNIENQLFRDITFPSLM